MAGRRITAATAAALLLAAASAAEAQPEGAPSLDDVAARAALDGGVIARLHGAGRQVYACLAPAAGGAPAWTFQEPVATLSDDAGRVVGRHSKGPVWRMDDGSALTGRSVFSEPGATPADVPQLRLEVVARSGSGPIAAAREVLRVKTQGGALSGACDTPGLTRTAPYTADYVFLR